MKAIITAFAIAATMIVCAPAYAANCADVAVLSSGNPFTTISLASGAVSADEMNVDAFDYATIHIDLVDADDLITNLQWSFTVTDEPGGQDRVYDDCTTVSPTMTCNGQLLINRDPQARGKNWAMPFPTKYEWVTLTFTPTGHGAGDTLTVKIRGCYEHGNR